MNPGAIYRRKVSSWSSRYFKFALFG